MEAQKTKLLYVDDEEINLLLFVANFEDKYDVLTSYSAVNALELISKNKDLKFVFADFTMPKMSGLDFIKKAVEISPDINYYILTGLIVSKELQQALDKKLIRKHFKKPIKMSEIEAEIRRVSDK